ncbi:hypothetical protein B2G88_13990 [Natronolimnobius baerhuensis]|uniref:HTH iclR-type domain-containing protein n=2 Tax=Natronolimnobius baerhuensis TaxID=253108 RepID=A0A202E5G8_9EURY|nr:hypothetical protein B2G88_13990 [Natronolimnobius baerhuensis]
MPVVAAEPVDTGPGAPAQGDISLGQIQDETENGNAVPDDQTGSDRLTDASEIHIVVSVHENHSATFEVDYRFENNSESNWETLRDDIETNTEEYAEAERSAWNNTKAEGENATEREMEIRDLSIETDTSSAPQDLGHVKISFEWTAFAYGELNRLEVDESLTGMTLMQDTTMQLFPPAGYVISNGDEDTEDDTDEATAESVFWHGDEVDFASDPPTVVMIENGNTNEAETEPESPDPDPEPNPAMPWLIVAAALVLLVVVAAVGWWLRDTGIVGPTEVTQPEETAASGPEAQPDPAKSVTEPPPELLSNEERVLRLLEQRGGRIKQQEVVSQLDWTEAKTSQVVSGLREDDDIEVFRIGRENVLSLPDGDEQATGDATSPGTTESETDDTNGDDTGTDE